MTSAPPLHNNDLADLHDAKAACDRIRAELGKVIVGQDATVRAVLAAVLAEGHSLIIGVPGLAKTLLVKTLATVLGWSFKRVQFTPDMMPADVIGMELLQDDPATGRRTMHFTPGPIFAQMVLADEINRTPPKTQAALLEAMQEYQVTSLGKSHSLPRPFLVFATQNPIEQEGTYPLPEAQLDRFLFSLWMDYPEEEEEVDIVMFSTDARPHDVKAVCTSEEFAKHHALVRKIPVSRHVAKYAVMLARSTRPKTPGVPKFVDDYVSWGAGPRASQHMILGAKALAVLDGAHAVTAEHVREAALLVLRHRILPNYAAAGKGIDSRALVRKLVEVTPEPGTPEE
ncbi:MAG TPA: MoxR family ATPase [Caulifigura sp.]|nr:MoxR family ATPase [Caulifigura sp.]